MNLTPQQLLTGIRNGRQQGLNDVALDILRKLLAVSQTDGSDFGQEWEEILDHALALADEESALEVTRRLVARFPNNSRYVMLMAERLSRVGRSSDALEMMRQLRPRTQHNPAIDYFEAVYAGHIGQLTVSRSLLRRAVEHKPDFGDAWALLGASGGLTPEDIPALEALVSGSAPHALPGAAYGLGGLYHTLGETEKAWSAWTQANQRLASQMPYSVETELAMHRAIRDADEKIWTDPALPPHKLPKVIFIVGPPRSGTSLVEQIIASGPKVKALGETMLSRLATWPLGNLGPGDMEKVGAFGPPGVTWGRLGAVYRHLASVRSADSPVVTDKGALLHLFVGALARMLPNAKFVWVRRDPRDVALSGYRSYLSQGNRWRHDLQAAAAYLRAHDDIMQFWQQKFPKQVYALDYAALTRAPQTQTDRLTDFLDLPDVDLSQTDFSGVTVPTASFAQVRSDITPASVGGWQAYEKWLGPAFQ